MKLIGTFFLLVGLLMIGQWAFFLGVDAVPEIHTEPVRIALHLAGEMLTAGSLVTAGIAAIRGLSWSKPLGLFAAGMLAYTVIVSPGYFAQQGQWPLVFMFAVLLVLDVLCVVRLCVAGKF